LFASRWAYLAPVGNIEMPIDVHYTYWWLVIIFFFISALFFAHNFIMLLLNRKNKYRRTMMLFFTFNMLFSTILLLFLVNSTEWVGIRMREIRTLSNLADSQRQYKRRTGNYASTFNELAFKPDEITLFRTTFHLRRDHIKTAISNQLPPFIKVDDSHIYSITCIGQNRYGGNCDILSVDYYGNVEILESFHYWPLPEPKWHDWK
jgi:hypothetical protein